MTPVVIDASAGAEMVGRTRRGQALARLLPTDALGWVPEHFYAEVASVLRRQLLVEPRISETQALRLSLGCVIGDCGAWACGRSSTTPGDTGTT